MKPALPYPIGLNVLVYKDDGRWVNYRAWFLRTQEQLNRLFVAKITLAHFEGDDSPCYSFDEWCKKADQLLEMYPDCIFVYGSNDRTEENKCHNRITLRPTQSESLACV